MKDKFARNGQEKGRRVFEEDVHDAMAKATWLKFSITET